MAQTPLIQIVDKDDKPVGAATKKEAQQQSLIHRIVHVIIENDEGLLLLQRRSLVTEYMPGRWDVSVGGHIDAGEDYLQAAEREMLEEVGLSGIELKEIGYFHKYRKVEWRHLNRFYKIFKATVPADTHFQLDTEEVMEVKWFTVTEAKSLIEDEDKVTGGLIEALNRFY